MKLTQRIRGAIDGFKLLRTDRQIIANIVRVDDERNEGRYKRQEFMALTARDSHYVHVANKMNAEAVASTPLRWYTRSRAVKAWDTRRAETDFTHAGRYARKAVSMSDEVTEIVDPLHPALALMESVNPWLNAFDLLEQTQMFLGLTGNAYWAVVREGLGGVPSAIWPLQPQYMDVLPDRAKFVAGYKFGRDEGEKTFYAAEDVIHFKNPNPNDPYYGSGDLAACVDQADLFVYLNQAASSMLKNGIQPGLVVSSETASETEREKMEKALNAKHSGSWKWYKALVFRGKTTFTTLDIGEGATKFLDIPASRIRATIANCFGVPEALLTLDSAALATAKAAIPQWQTRAIMPRCRRIEDQINARLTPMFGDPNLFCAFDNAVAEDQDALATRLATLVGSRPILTQNEARAELRKEPIDEGDELNPPEPEPLGGGFEEGGKRDSSAKAMRSGPRLLSEWSWN